MMTILILVAVTTVLAAAAYLLLQQDDDPRKIAPASELQRKYGLYAEYRPDMRLDPERVPEALRHLVPHAEKWGIGDDIIRNDLIDKATAAEKRELHDALYEPYEQINSWLSSFGTAPMTDEAVAFMYMQEALDEMGYHILDERRRSP